MKAIAKFILILLINLIYAHPIYAKSVEQKEFNFKIQTEDLLKGEVHYAFQLLTPKELVGKFPEAIELDSTGSLMENKVRIVLTKSVYIVNKAAAFFSDENLKLDKYLSHTMGDQQFKKSGADTLLVTVPGKAGHTYKMKTFFDSDDITTLPSPRIVQSVTAARKLDVISQSASSIVFREFTQYSKYSHAGTNIHSYISLKEGKTLVIAYSLMAIKKKYAIEKALRISYINETEAVHSLINSYEP